MGYRTQADRDWRPLVAALAQRLGAVRDLTASPLILCPGEWQPRWLGQQLSLQLGVLAGVRWLDPTVWLNAQMVAQHATAAHPLRVLWALHDLFDRSRCPDPALERLHGAYRQADGAARQALCAHWADRLDAQEWHQPDFVRACVRPEALSAAILDHGAEAPVDDRAVTSALWRQLAREGLSPRAALSAQLTPADWPLALWQSDPPALLLEVLSAAQGPELLWARWQPHAQTPPESIHCAEVAPLFAQLAQSLAHTPPRPELGEGPLRILCAEPEAVAPWAQRFFGARWPLHVGDQRIEQTNAIAQMLRALFALFEGRFEVSAVWALLAQPAVHSHFEIAEADLAQIEGWLAQVGVHFGADGPHRADLGLPPDALHTWRFGLQRLLLGVTMAEGDTLVRGVRPFDEVLGQKSLLVGGLADFLQILFDLRVLWREAATGPEWAQRVRSAVHQLLGRDALLGEAWAQLADTVDDLAWAQARLITRPQLAVHLRRAWRARRMGRGALCGAVELAALDPLSLVPAQRTVVLHVLPPTPDAPALGVAQLAGLGTQLCLARSVTDLWGRPLAPPAHWPPEAVEIAPSEAQDHRGARAEPPSPLVAPGALMPQPLAALPEALAGTLPVRSLVNFYLDPIDALLDRLKLRAPFEGPQAQDSPPLLFNALAQWRVDDLFLKELMRHGSEGQARANLRATGLLAPKQAGQLALEVAAERTTAIYARYLDLVRSQRPLPPLPVDVRVGDLRLQGLVKQRWAAGMVLVIPGQIRARHQLSLWLEYLVARCAGLEGEALLLGRDPRGYNSDAPLAYRFSVSPAQAQTLLPSLLALRALGLRAPLPLSPDLGLACVEACAERGGLASPSAQRTLQRLWGWSLRDRPQLAALAGEACPLLPQSAPPPGVLALAPQQLIAAAHEIWQPLLSARKSLF